MAFTDKIPDIDFSRIRTLGNSKNKGFEELAVQLFRSTFPEQTDFYRVDDAGGDGGVEDIALLADRKKVGLQAKFLDKLDQTQWTQIKKSVETALKTHYPDLVEYRIATPVNRSKTTKTWSNYVTKWNKYAVELGYTTEIKFTWEGETELRRELIKDTHKAEVYYWFGCPSFSDDWLKAKYDSCKKLLDTRYTPKRHVRTDSEQILDAFFLTDGFIHTFFQKWQTLISICQECVKNCPDTSLASKIIELNSAIESLKSVTQGVVPAHSKIKASLEVIGEQIDNFNTAYLELRAEKESEEEKSDKNHSRAFSYELIKIDNARDAIWNVRDYINKYKGYDKQLSLITGEAGTGKSHLLAKAIERALDRKQPGLLLAGEQFTTGTPPLEQLCQCLGWEHGVEALLGCLNTEAIVHKKPAVIAIDALNDSNERKLWKSHLISTAEIVQRYPNIKLLVSCRSDFAPFVLPEPLVKRKDEKWEFIEHTGYDADVLKAIEVYFNGYNIQCDHFPPLLEELKNPLFLKTFCEAYQGKSIPKGTLSFDTVMKERVKHCQKMILTAIDCPIYKTKNALDLMATKIAENNGFPISHSSIRPTIDALFDGGGESRSLYIHLRSNGMLVETLQGSIANDDEPEIMVRFPYERFSDYFIASRLLNTFDNLAELKKAWADKNLPDSWIQDWQAVHMNRGLLRMMSILIPERFGIEFIKLISSDQIPELLLKDFADTLIWRTEASFNEDTTLLFEKCADILKDDDYLNIYFRLMTIPNHPFNANHLHKRLISMDLRDREVSWTIPISNLTSYNGNNTVDNIIRWVFKVSDSLISDEQAWLAGIFLTWLLTSNHRFLRYRATLALIKMLENRTVLAARLIEEFHDCNDPYVVERVYAAACGVALRERSRESLKELSRIIYHKMFSAKNVPIHILQRDYAQLIMERAAFLNALPEEVDISRCKPVFNSEWPHIITEEEAAELENRNGWFNIRRSLQPESSRMYGDFGRYVMDVAVHKFSNQKLDGVYEKKEMFSDEFQGVIARRYILGRINQFGWSPESFEGYERGLGGGRMRADIEKNKVERISKKYQWIGLHELMGSLSDFYWMMPDYGQERPSEFTGAWQLSIRDFDPSQPLLDPLDNLDIEEDDVEKIPVNTNETSWHNYPNPFSDAQLRANREAWVLKSPEDFQTLIEQDGLPGKDGKWLALSSHFNWAENLLISQDESKEGRLKMWADLRCWLVKKENKDSFLEYIRDINFYGNSLDYPELYDRWIGEYPWASSCRNIKELFEGDIWLRDCPIEVIQTVCGVHNESAGFYARLPSPIVLSLMNLSWAGNDYDYIDLHSKTLAFNLNYGGEGSHLFVSREEFLSSTDSAGYVPFWAVLSERSCYSAKAECSIVKKWAITQRVYGYEDMQFKCYQNKKYEIPLYH